MAKSIFGEIVTEVTNAEAKTYQLSSADKVVIVEAVSPKEVETNDKKKPAIRELQMKEPPSRRLK